MDSSHVFSEDLFLKCEASNVLGAFQLEFIIFDYLQT